jgi:hypothetical protein
VRVGKVARPGGTVVGVVVPALGTGPDPGERVRLGSLRPLLPTSGEGGEVDNTPENIEAMARALFRANAGGDDDAAFELMDREHHSAAEAFREKAGRVLDDYRDRLAKRGR